MGHQFNPNNHQYDMPVERNDYDQFTSLHPATNVNMRRVFSQANMDEDIPSQKVFDMTRLRRRAESFHSGRNPAVSIRTRIRPPRPSIPPRYNIPDYSTLRGEDADMATCVAALVEVKRRTSFSALAEHISQENLLAELAEATENDRSPMSSQQPLPTIPESPRPPAAETSAADASTESSNCIASPPIDYFGYTCLSLLLLITIFGVPGVFISSTAYGIVTYYAWITAVSTGLGVLPFYFISNPNPYYMGLSNAVAGGMMVAASWGLVTEGINVSEPADFCAYSTLFRVCVGFGLGALFIYFMKTVLHHHDDLDAIDTAGIKKMVLIILVMFLHSAAEGIGIGVSFGGEAGNVMGRFISLSLAIHNVPEGLAVALVLLPKGVTKLRTGLWAVFTSLPQPVMALAAYLFIESFVPVLPVGLGFAAGAMGYVSVFELLAEAVEDTSLTMTSAVSVVAFMLMYAAQELLKDV